MELEELKAGWNVLNERLAQNEILNKRIIKDMIVTRNQLCPVKIKMDELGRYYPCFRHVYFSVDYEKYCGYSSGSNDYFRIAGGAFLFTVFVISVFWSVWI